MTTNASVLVTKAQADAHFTLSILPILLERKRLILSRIGELGGEAAIEALERIADAPDANVSELRAALGDVREKLEASLTASRDQDELDRDITRSQRRLEIARARAEIWQSFLARESVASIVGGVLLLLIGIAIVVAMLVGVTVPNLLGELVSLDTRLLFRSVCRTGARFKARGRESSAV